MNTRRSEADHERAREIVFAVFQDHERAREIVFAVFGHDSDRYSLLVTAIAAALATVREETSWRVEQQVWEDAIAIADARVASITLGTPTTNAAHAEARAIRDALRVWGRGESKP